MFHFHEDQLDHKIQQHEKKIKELSIQTDTLEREFNQLLTDLKVTREQLSAYVENQNHFSANDWEEIQRQKQALDQKLLTQLKNICDPSKTKKTFQERKDIQPQWLYVK